MATGPARPYELCLHADFDKKNVRPVAKIDAKYYKVASPNYLRFASRPAFL